MGFKYQNFNHQVFPYHNVINQKFSKSISKIYVLRKAISNHLKYLNGVLSLPNHFKTQNSNSKTQNSKPSKPQNSKLENCFKTQNSHNSKFKTQNCKTRSSKLETSKLKKFKPQNSKLQNSIKTHNSKLKTEIFKTEQKYPNPCVFLWGRGWIYSQSKNTPTLVFFSGERGDL